MDIKIWAVIITLMKILIRVISVYYLTLVKFCFLVLSVRSFLHYGTPQLKIAKRVTNKINLSFLI
ncbi:hypothetical protein Xkoz_03345 [Xenorhabdus kozodoii]|uniref:Uncharacterized protein n=1 Tax=Xenorhabdus kozodoii TaxID=351676 RepID=A0A2D0L218_9GAMM|nr:hypothetical protein Xkoz_03345 [Xenorhabdus kozodoii]